MIGAAPGRGCSVRRITAAVEDRSLGVLILDLKPEPRVSIAQLL